MAQVTKEYVRAASEEHHTAAHQAQLDGLPVSENRKEQIVKLRAPHVAKYIADNPDHGYHISSMPEDEQAKEVARLHGELTGLRASPNAGTDAHVTNRKRKNTSTVISRLYGARR